MISNKSERSGFQKHRKLSQRKHNCGQLFFSSQIILLFLGEAREANAIGRWSWMRTAPTPTLLASVSTTNSLVKSGWAKAGAEDKAVFRVWKACWQVLSQLKGWFFSVRVVSGLAIVEKFLINRRNHEAIPTKRRISVTDFGHGKSLTARIFSLSGAIPEQLTTCPIYFTSDRAK